VFILIIDSLNVVLNLLFVVNVVVIDILNVVINILNVVIDILNVVFVDLAEGDAGGQFTSPILCVVLEKAGRDLGVRNLGARLRP